MFLLGQLDGETFDRTAVDVTLPAQAKLNLSADDAEKKVFNQTKNKQLDKQHFYSPRNREACVMYVPPTPTVMLIWCWDVGQPALPDSPSWTVFQQKVLNTMITTTAEEEQTQKCCNFFRQQNQVNTYVAV